VGQAAHLDDVARIHVESLDEDKVPGNANFVVGTGDGIEDVQWDSAIEIVKEAFPDAVEKGILSLGGTRKTNLFKLNLYPTDKVFGPLKTFEDAVKSVVAHYIELKEKATSQL
jgi:hypothetical protein